jgi:MFS family permease
MSTPPPATPAASGPKPKPASDDRAYRPSHLAYISFFFCSTGIAEATSNYILPDTIRGFTQNAFVISVILSMNPLFGFVAQPWAGWYSDRIWTRLGRRRPLILAGCVCIALSALGLPLAQQQAAHVGFLAPVLRFFGSPEVSLGLVIVGFWNLVYQAAVDVVSIMIRSLVGDIVPLKHRATAFGLSNVVSTCMIFATLWWGSAIAKQNQLHWYLIVSLVVLVATLPGTFLLREPHVPAPAPAEGEGKDASGFRAYVATIRDTPHFFRMCMVVACTFVAGQLITNYYRLFTKEQLNLPLDEALKPFSWMPVIAFFASFPIGWLSDRVSQKYVLMAGAVLLGFAGIWGVFATSILDLTVMALVVGVGLMAVDISGNAYLISLMPPGKIGQLSGFANIFRGFPRFLMFFGAGALIEVFDRNYRIAFGGAVLFAIVALFLITLLPKETAQRPAP